MVDVYFVTLLTVELFLYTFHLSMLILLFCKRHSTFKGPFYNIFRIVIVADFLNYLAVNFFIRIFGGLHKKFE